MKQLLSELKSEADKKGKKENKPSIAVAKEVLSSDSKSSVKNRVNQSNNSFQLIETEKNICQGVQASVVKKDDKAQDVNSSNKADKQSINVNSHVNKNSKINDLKVSAVPDNNNNTSQSVLTNKNSSNNNNSNVSVSSAHCKQILQLREHKEKQATQKCTKCHKEYHPPLNDIFHICSNCFATKIIPSYEQCLVNNNTDMNTIHDKLIFNHDNGSTTINGMLLYYTTYPSIDASITKHNENFVKHVQKKKSQQCPSSPSLTSIFRSPSILLKYRIT